MWNRMDAMLLAGNAGNGAFGTALGGLIQERVMPDARRRRIPELDLAYHPDAWETEIPVLLSGLPHKRAARRYYAFDRLRIDWPSRLPEGCRVQRLDANLLTGAPMENLQAVLGWVHSFWRSSLAFLQTGFGYCLLRRDAILSWCLTVYASGTHVELGLATAPAHRRQGHATLVAGACVEHCMQHGLTPHWHCWEEHVASRAIAETVGFGNPTSYIVYRLTL
jgi:GNAT superfamily N-acetyltransferase